jgi:17beta-estradiol 17-dehydrogenase / very-long-chain 3-oxoacyl-CoA reductase
MGGVKAFKFVSQYYFSKPKDLFKLYNGGWAIVTGSTNGVGQEYAKQLAKRGFNIVQVARNQDKLEATQKLLHEINPDIEIRNILFNFDVPYTNEGYDSLK